MFDQNTAASSHRIMWWVHMLLSMAFIAYIPYSKLFHAIMSPANMYLKNFGPRGRLTTMDLENSETFGVTDIHEFTWKQLFELDACIHCGRCQDQCPAGAIDRSGKIDRLACIKYSMKSPLFSHFMRLQEISNEDEQMINHVTAIDDHSWYCCIRCVSVCPYI